MSGNGDYISREAMINLVEDDGHANEIDLGWPDGNMAFVEMIKELPAADVRPVVTCSDCKWWTKQESSLQGRCELLQMYPTGAWFCANGKREES